MKDKMLKFTISEASDINPFVMYSSLLMGSSARDNIIGILGIIQWKI